MENYVTKKDLGKMFGIGDTTVRETLRACGFDTKLQEYPLDEIEEIFAPARKLLAEGTLSGYEEMSDWARKRRVEVYGEPKEEPPSRMDSLLEEELLNVTQGIISRAITRNMDKIPDLFQTEMIRAIKEGELHGAFLVWEEKRLSATKKEIRQIPLQKKGLGLPFTQDDVIETPAEDVSDDSFDEEES